MALFDKPLNERLSVNRTSTSRWHVPSKDAVFNRPDWAPINRPGDHSTAQIEIDIPSDQPSIGEFEIGSDATQEHATQLALSRGAFDDMDLARMSAKAAALAFQAGEAKARGLQIEQQNVLMALIHDQIQTFTSSVTLPIDAIRREMGDLLKAMLERLELPDDENRKQILMTGIERCLTEISKPIALTLRLNTKDAQFVNSSLTKMFDTLDQPEVTIMASDETPPGVVHLDWPGGGMERVVTGRREALHFVLDRLASGSNVDDEDRDGVEPMAQGDEN